MEILRINNKQPYKPVDKVIIFAHDKSDKFYCDIKVVDRIANGNIYVDDDTLIVPMTDAKPFNSPDGMVYAVNCSLEYLTEIQHLGDVEKNIIVEQAFLYPGNAISDVKNGIGQYIIYGILGLIAIIAIFV